jgi:hypothetical protein
VKAKRNELVFVRWGGLSPVVQKGYNPSMPTFHCPPARRGIYAFPWPMIETFMLFDGGNFQNHRMEWVKDEAGNKIPYDHPELNKYYGRRANLKAFFIQDKNGVECLARHVDPRKFKHDGEVWHHLPNMPRSHRMEEKGSWIRSSFEDYRRELNREIGRVKKWRYAKDHLEVFIESIRSS